jgi:hypothetical protein
MTTCELSRQRKLSRKCGTPPCSKGEGFLLDSKMWIPNKNGGEPPAKSESLAEARHAFRHVYGFILQAVKGDKAAARAIFEDYLAGKLSDELLSISRHRVSADQAGSSKRQIKDGLGGAETIKSGRGAGVGDDAFTALS